MVIIRARRNAHARTPAKRTTTSLVGFFDQRGLACTVAVLVHDIACTKRQERPAAKRIAELTAAEFRTAEDAGPKGGVASGAFSASSRGAVWNGDRCCINWGWIYISAQWIGRSHWEGVCVILAKPGQRCQATPGHWRQRAE